MRNRFQESCQQLSNWENKIFVMEAVEKPSFVPPRKRGSKSSTLSSNESLQMLGTNSAASPQGSSLVDHRANRRLHQPLIGDQGRDYVNIKVHPSSQAAIRHNSPGKRSITYQNPPSRSNGRSDESEDVNSDVSDFVQINDSGADVDQVTERSALNSRSLSSIGSCDKSFVTMTGTIKRGRKKGQTMDMKVQMSREELDELEHSIVSHQTEDEERCFFSFRKGPHVLVLSIVLFPFIFFFSCCYSFYMGTMTWYNMLVYFSENKTVIHKIFISPLLIILYPFLIVLSTFGLGVYAAFVQLAWHFDTWRHEAQDLEKGFYGWLCGVLNLEDCSPYEVVILTEVLPPPENDKSQKSQIADTAL